jgi:hypothetical protein
MSLMFAQRGYQIMCEYVDQIRSAKARHSGLD